MAHITTRLARGYLDSNAQAMDEAIALIKHLLISTVSDESIVLLADSLRGIIVVRGLPHCLSFEVTMLLPFLFHCKDKPGMILWPHSSRYFLPPAGGARGARREKEDQGPGRGGLPQGLLRRVPRRLCLRHGVRGAASSSPGVASQCNLQVPLRPSAR